MNIPLISICIPTYNQPQFIKRCLDSILKQDYEHLEVIISDDSSSEDIKEAIAPFQNNIFISYFSNKPALKSPQNWNSAIDKAKGDLILLLHQDDWLHAPDALSSYVAAFKSSFVSLVFSRNTAVNEQGKIITLQKKKLVRHLDQKPTHLLFSQVIGPPSNLMFRSNIKERFDNKFIWLVDIDFYIRLFNIGLKYKYLDRHLVSIGLHKDQTTVFCQTHPEIIFRENIILAGKLGKIPFYDLKFFDYYWRLLRNYDIRSVEDFIYYDIDKEISPHIIFIMITMQKKISSKILYIGVFSKLFMCLCFIKWRLTNFSSKRFDLFLDSF